MSNVGTLSVRVFTSRAELPVEGATVVVTQKDESGRQELLSLQVTNSSGLIKPISIPAPAPGTDPPFIQCSVWAEHEGFSMLQVEGVQIFPGVETLQDMRLIPLNVGENSLQQRDIRDVSVQDL